MSLDPFFSITPNSPSAYTYDAANPTVPYASAHLNSFGGFSSSVGPYRLQDQSANDEIILGYDPVAPGDATINSVTDDFYRRCSIRGYFYGANVATDNQYLLLAQLNGRSQATAQFFVGTALVREEAISGDEQVAVLMDVPGSGVGVTFFIRLASNVSFAQMGFRGLDCYLL